MIVKIIATGATLDCAYSYAARLIEQGLATLDASPAQEPAVPTPAYTLNDAKREIESLSAAISSIQQRLAAIEAGGAAPAHSDAAFGLAVFGISVFA